MVRKYAFLLSFLLFQATVTTILHTIILLKDEIFSLDEKKILYTPGFSFYSCYVLIVVLFFPELQIEVNSSHNWDNCDA